ncbi:IclR family transcriptional regulator [Natronosalvus rutilus]|uniref:IclR family transcriptional regulator n=1 Tax=Natronosalvus rutilus TaxID=2953753 RepID=A0A9E7SZ80_9EURY|nr:IclR family transcriptional regulator [Natronosalvus rutilus]UTF55723.1 IclR family transcriptional regulator [Natronosalvus rutilus]
MARSKKAKNPVGATSKSLKIIDELKQRDGAGITELADALDASKGTVHNHLSTLEEHEYVVKEDSTYRLGLRFLDLGEYTRQQTKLFEVAKAEIDDLANETGEIANLMIEEHGRGIYIYISKGDKAVNLDTHVGTRQYLHTSAVGKSILSKMGDEQFKRIIELHGLPAETANTVTSKEKLLDELDEIRDRGVAFDGEERAEGIRCVAAPITDNDDNLLGGVSISGPSTRLKGDRLHQEIPEKVQHVATVIGINAFYS